MYFVRINGLTVTPDDLSEFPDFPKKSENMSKEEFQTEIQRYWEAKTRPKCYGDKVPVVNIFHQKN